MNASFIFEESTPEMDAASTLYSDDFFSFFTFKLYIQAKLYDSQFLFIGQFFDFFVGIMTTQ